MVSKKEVNVFEVKIHKVLLQAIREYLKTGGNLAPLLRPNKFGATSRFDITINDFIRYVITGYGENHSREGELIALHLSYDRCPVKSFTTLEIKSSSNIFKYYDGDYNTPLVFALVWLGIAIPNMYDGYKLLI